jgi:hypothetical protein
MEELKNIECVCNGCGVTFMSSLSSEVMTCPKCGEENKLEEKPN